MATIANLLVKLDLEDTAFQKGLDSSRAKMDKWGQNLRNVGTKMTAGVTLPLVGAGTAFVNWASDLEESVNKTTVIFGQNSDAMIAWSGNSAKTMGMSQQAALDYSSAFAGMFQNIADGPDQLMDMSQAMTQLTTDFGSFHNLNPEEAFTVIQSALAGETEAIRRYGVDVSAAAVETKALEMGLAATTGELTEQDKALARYQIILDETGEEQGDFARTSDSTSNKLKIFKARIQDVGAAFGSALLPFVNKILDGFMKLLSGLEKMNPAMKNMVLVVAAIAAAMGPLLIVIGMMLPGLAAMGTAIAFLVSPVGLVVIAIAALVAGLIYAYTHFAGFRNAVDALLGPIGAAIGKLREFVGLLFGVPENKSIGVTLNTSLSDPEDAWSNWTKMPDGSWKHSTLGITSHALDATVTEMIDPATGEKSWSLNVDVDGDGSADAMKIIDSVDQGGGKYVMTVEIDGTTYEAWYDEKTGETIIVPMEVSITNEGEINGKLDGWKNRRETFEIWVKVINFDLMERLQGLSDSLLGGIQSMADGFGTLASKAVMALGDVSMTLYQGGVDMLQGFWQGVLTTWNVVALWFSFLGMAAFNAVSSLTATLLSRGTELLMGFWTGATNQWATARTWFVNLGTMAFNAVGSLTKALWDRGTQALSGFYMAVVDGWQFGGARGWFTGLADKVAGAVTGMGSALYNAGLAVMDGFKSGLSDGWGVVTNFLSGLNPADWKGPEKRDKKMLYKPGIWIMEGLGHGLDDGWGDVTRQLSGYVPTVNSTIGSGAGSNAGSGQVVHNHNYFVTPEALKEMIEGGKFARQFGNELAMMEGLA